MKPERLESRGLIRKIDEAAMRVTSVISTGDVARDGAIIDPLGWIFDNYDRNPIVLWGHDDSAMPIARTVERHAGVEGLIATAEFDRADPEAVRLFGKVKRGYVNAASVRWLPIRTEVKRLSDAQGLEREVLIFREQELLEWSFVAIPADVGAVVMRAGEALDVAAFVRSLHDEDGDRGAIVAPSPDTGRIAALVQRVINAPHPMGPGTAEWYAGDELATLDPLAYRSALAAWAHSRVRR